MSAPGLAGRMQEWRRRAGERLAAWAYYLEGPPDLASSGRAIGLLRPKGHVSRGMLIILLTMATLPLLSMALRIAAWPGVLDPGWAGTLVTSVGQTLNDVLSLHNVAPMDRDRILYVLFVPVGAVLIAVMRLTLGVRVIGFRAILIAVGFQHSGIVNTLLLMGVVVLLVIAIRPALVRMRLPYYARVAVIMCVAVLVLLGALILAPSLRSETLWSVAFFPVLVLGLMAEGIAKTIDRDTGLVAFWRTGMTVLIAVVLALISRIPVLREIALEFPELVLTELALIVLIAEYLDLRLFQDWDARLSGLAPQRLFGRPGTGTRIALVTNDGEDGVIGALGPKSRGRYRRRVVRGIADALQERGHSVERFEGDITLLSGLREFIPAHPLSGQPGGIVLNLSHGIQGDVAAAHVPAMLEMAGIAYTGPAVAGLACMGDLVLFRRLVRAVGIDTPDSRLVTRPNDAVPGLLFPAVVRHRYAAGRKARIVHDRGELQDVVSRIVGRTSQPVIVEELVAGREIDVPILGNAPPRCLPLVEILADGDRLACPAALEPAAAAAVRAAALAAFVACGGRDYGVINLRLTPGGKVVVVHALTGPVLEPDESLAVAATGIGLTYGDLLDAVITVARERYRPDTAGDPLATADPGGVSSTSARSGAVAG